MKTFYKDKNVTGTPSGLALATRQELKKKINCLIRRKTSYDIL